MAPSSTWVLSAGAIEDVALPSVAMLPVDRALGRLLPTRSPGLAELFRGPRSESAPARPGAVVLVRAPASPRPSLAPDPVDVATRRGALEALAEQELRETQGLFAEVEPAGHEGSSGAFEEVCVLRVVVNRDDVDGASSELDAVRALERAIASRPELSPCEVVGDYVK